MTKYFADVSSWNRDDPAYFKMMYDAGVAGIMIKATEGSADGTAYVNTKIHSQTRNALDVGMNVGFFHYLMATGTADAINEAKFFIQNIEALGFGKDTALAVDVEDSKLNKNMVASYTDTFLNYLTEQGYTNVFQYSFASWFTTGILDAYKHRTWVAHTESTDVGVFGNLVGWQYTWSWGGYNQDMSIDYGVFDTPNKVIADNKPVTPVVEKPKVDDIIKLTADVVGVDGLGIERDITYKKDTNWKSSDIVMMNGEPHYKIATNIYVPLSKTTSADVVTVKYINGKSAPLFDSKGKRTVNSNVTVGKSFINGGVEMINNLPMVKIATEEYLPLEYTSGSKFK